MFSCERDMATSQCLWVCKFCVWWVFLDVSLIPVSFLSPDILWFSDYHIQQRKISTEPEYFIALPHISSVALLSVAGRFSKCNYLKLSKIN